MIAVVMGVAGCGKTTLGLALADALGWTFLDADDFHPPANVAKMAAGVALTDADRWPWLDRLAEHLRGLERDGRDVVLACSALKQAYRERLACAGDLRWIYLKGDAATIGPRLSARHGHYMPASQLASQLATLEEPQDAIVVDVRDSTGAQVAQVASRLRGGAASRTRSTR